MAPVDPAAFVYAAADVPASSGWALATAAVPAAITLVGTLWQVNASRRVPPSRRDGVRYAERIWRLERSGPRWPILPRFARQMIIWHVLVAGVFVVTWFASTSSTWWLLPLAVLYGLAAAIYAVVLWRMGSRNSNSTVVRLDLEARQPRLSMRCLQAVTELGLEVTFFEHDEKSSRLGASDSAAALTITIEPVASCLIAGSVDAEADPSRREQLLGVEITCTPIRGIDGAWRSRRIVDWFATEILQSAPEPGDDGVARGDGRIARS